MAGLRPPSMISFRPVVRARQTRTATEATCPRSCRFVGPRPLARSPCHWPGHQGHWPRRGASVRGMPHAGTHPGVTWPQARPNSSGLLAREHCAKADLEQPPREHLTADWPRPAQCPRGRRSRAPLAIRPAVPAQLTAHKRAGLNCIPAPRLYGADGDPSTATTARPAPTERPPGPPVATRADGPALRGRPV